MKKIACILLVEDDEVANFLNTTLIEMAGICDQVVVCVNGQEALDYLKSQGCPDIIFLDVKMPVMNGIEFLHAFHDEQLQGKEHTRIVILSSTSSEKDMEIIKSYRLPLLEKPLSNEKLMKVVEGRV